jgi:hypothetical protein
VPGPPLIAIATPMVSAPVLKALVAKKDSAKQKPEAKK